MSRHSNNATQMPKLSEFIIDGKPTLLCWNYISTLSKVVISKYFAKYLEHFDREDLSQLATTDAVAFTIKVASLQSDSDIRNIRNVLFTRIRNTLSNFIFRSNKLVSTDDDILDKQIVYPKSYDFKSDIIDINDLLIDSINSFRSVSLRTWLLYKANGTKCNYFINDSNNSLDDWKTYSEVRNMKVPCDLISYYETYSDEQIESLADKLDSITGQNYFNTLYQLLGDKFLAFLDVFQEDKFNIPSTVLVKHVLSDISICNDFNNGLSVCELSTKYNKSQTSIQHIVDSKEVI
jgi:hypothetical protein